MHPIPKQMNKNLAPLNRVINEIYLPPSPYLVCPQGLSDFPMKDFLFLCSFSILTVIALFLVHTTRITTTSFSLASHPPFSLLSNSLLLILIKHTFLKLAFFYVLLQLKNLK